jgi:hypothetical protein
MLRETAERYDLTRCWLWCDRCREEHDAWLWREGGEFGLPSMEWIGEHEDTEGGAMTTDTPREPTTAETDQLEAHLRDLLERNDLQVVDRAGFDLTWLEEHTAEEFCRYLSASSIAAAADGVVTLFMAQVVEPGGLAYCVVGARRAGEDGES